MIPENDLHTLTVFNEKVERLEATGLAAFLGRDMPNVTMTAEDISWTRESAVRLTMTGRIRSSLDNVTQDQIDAFVLTYRMFIQTNDRVSLTSLAKTYGREWMPIEAAESFREAMTQVDDYLDSTPTVEFGEGPVTRRHLVDTIIYGGLAHTKPAKEREYLSWSSDGGLTGFMWAEFIVTLQQMLKYLAFFRQLNQAVIINCGG